jgi:ABC-2 type transport system permease protein
MTMVNLLFLLVAVASGVVINGACNILIGAVSFWTIKSGMLYNTILWPAQFLSYIPLIIFPKGIQFVYTYIFPLGYTGYYPATILLGKNSELTNPNVPYYAPVIAVGFFAMTVVVWRIGLERFEGTGS